MVGEGIAPPADHTGVCRMTLNITQENGRSIAGGCTIGTSNFTIQNGAVDTSGNIQFSINAVVNSTNVVITFNGTAQSSRGWQGTFADTNNDQGTRAAS